MPKGSFQLRMVFALAAFIGAILLPSINLQLNPSPRVQHLEVNYSYPQAGPQEVERQVTSLLESALSRLDHLNEIISTSAQGEGQISLSFGENADMTNVRLNASVLIRQIHASLPAGVSYPTLSYRSKYESKSALLSYAIISDMAGDELGQVIHQKLLLPLASSKGISEISLRGIQKNECRIVLDHDLLSVLQLTNQDIIQAINETGRRYYLGSVVSDNGSQLSINMGSKSYSGKIIENIERLPITIVEDRIITLGDIASIDLGPEKEQSYYRINGLRSTSMIIYVDEDVNFIKLAESIRNKVTELTSSLPLGIDIIIESDRSAHLSKELRKIGVRLLAAILILFISMIIIYRDVLKLFAVWSGFLISLLMSVVIYYFANIELHLYSLAGLSLSFGIVLDNLIVSTDHLHKQKNQKIFVALLAATLTTVGALSIIFFISPEYREQLTDFAWVFIINVFISLLVSLLYIPSVLDSNRYSRIRFGRAKKIVRLNKIYGFFSHWTMRHRWMPLSLLILAFGLPLFLIPNEIKSEQKSAQVYNRLMDGWYGRSLHPTLSKYLGGTFRLFTLSKDQFYFANTAIQETRLIVKASVPFGGTIDHLNDINKDFESYIISFNEVDQVNSVVSSAESSSIEVIFKKEYSEGGFPYRLKALLESKAVEMGSGDFQIFGVGRGFDNELYGSSLNTHLRLLGYNYNQLQKVASDASTDLLRNMRIQKVFVNPTRNEYAPDDRYFQLQLDQLLLKQHPSAHEQDFQEYWQNVNPDKGVVARLTVNNRALPIRLWSGNKSSNTIWEANHTFHRLDTATVLKNAGISSLMIRHGESKIVRYNQQYQLYLEYDFIGNRRLAQQVQDNALKEISAQLPPGYQISDDRSGWWWRESDDKLIFIVLGSLSIIFLISAILFNSLRQALVPLLLVPVSFIGIFLVVHLFNFRFDQGGFAAFLLVGGLSVNAGIFVINDYNNIKKRNNISDLKAYIKACNSKIIPIILTLASTILGLLPVLLFDKNEPFWYALAVCTIAGLIFSVLGMVLLLPLIISD